MLFALCFYVADFRSKMCKFYDVLQLGTKGPGSESLRDVKDKELIERIQHRFIRMLPEIKALPYHERLQRLNLWSLELSLIHI